MANYNMGGGEIWTLISDAVKIAPFWFVPKDTENPSDKRQKAKHQVELQFYL